MISRTRRGRAAAGITALATAAVVGAVTPVAAVPTASPEFLVPGDLPPHASSPWYAGEEAGGMPDPLPFCMGDALSAAARHRTFWTEFDTGATQIIVVESGKAGAEALAESWNESVSTCADRAERQDPDVTAQGKDHGNLDVGDGAHVYAVHTAYSWGATDINLFSVGREGSTVTLVTWGQMGDFEDAQVPDFQRTTRVAVEKLS